MDSKTLLIKTVCERMPWKVLQVALKSVKLPVSKGTEATLDKLLNLVTLRQINDVLERQLFNLYCDYLKFGDKTVRFDSASTESIQFIVDNVDKMQLDISPNDINFPFRDSDSDCKLSSKYKLVQLDNTEEHIYFYFVSLKSLTEKIVLDSNYLQSINASFSLPLDLFNITANQRKEKRYYDIVCVNKRTGVVDYRLDTASGLSTDDLESSFRDLKTYFATKIQSLEQTNAVQLSFVRKNLFPFIPALYLESDDRVCELGFQVGSVTHHERMRVSNKDLRDEIFHKAGKKEVDSIDVFRIAVRKLNKINHQTYESEVYLPGTIKLMSGSSISKLDHAIFSNCLNENDYNYLMSSMENCMSKYQIDDFIDIELVS